MNKSIISKATMHRGAPRARIKSAPNHPMLAAGFTPRARYNVEYLKDNVVLTLASDGKRGVSDCARGAILDIGGKKMRAYDFEHGINWNFQLGKITITPVKGAL